MFNQYITINMLDRYQLAIKWTLRRMNPTQLTEAGQVLERLQGMYKEEVSKR